MRIDSSTRPDAHRPETTTDHGLALAVGWGVSGPKRLLVGMLALVSLTGCD
jgi:hypothetical protein